MSETGNLNPENPSSNTRSRSRNRAEEAARQQETPRLTMAINIAGQNWQNMIGTYTGTID